MKITDYDAVVSLSANNVLLIDGPNGTKKITASNAAKSGLSFLSSDDYFNFLDSIIPLEERRNTFRGKNLGNSFTAEQKANIRDGSFKGLFLGDSWTIGGVEWRIWDFDYWWNSGDSSCTAHHLVILPDSSLYSAKMNETNTTEGGYFGSLMRTSGLDRAKEKAIQSFGEGNILKHREYLTNAVTNGAPSGGGWYDSTLELPNEIMMYGTEVYNAIVPNETSIPYKYTIDRTQLALSKCHPKYNNLGRYSYWLRDVVTSAYFARAGNNGLASYNGASGSLEVRPVFGISG